MYFTGSVSAMSVHDEQHHVIKFYYRRGKTVAQIYEKLRQKYLGKNRLSRATVFRWHKLFAEGREST